MLSRERSTRGAIAWLALLGTSSLTGCENGGHGDNDRERAAIGSQNSSSTTNRQALEQGPLWTLASSGGPLPRVGHAMAYDVAGRNVWLFGGNGIGATTFGDTWSWDGTVWNQRSSAGPAPRSSHAMAYDAARGRVMLFGGGNGSGELGDTWQWDGSSWSERPVPGPSQRYGHAMVYDGSRQRVVLFGGQNLGGRLGDTWQWDGVAWTLVSTTGPEPRVWHAMIYDDARMKVVLFGGFVTAGQVADTWEWDGTSWTQRTPAQSPRPRMNHAMVYDQGRAKLVLFGGDDFGGLDDTWEWDGTTWAERLAAGGPGPRFGHTMAYDSARTKLMLFGGIVESDIVGDTWEAASVFGVACTSTSQCAAGTCLDGVCCNTTAPSCGQCQACNVPGFLGTCTAAASGTSCSDGNACTQIDSCQAGSCLGSRSVVCHALDQCHLVGTCDPSTGRCSTPAVANGTACNDGLSCTQKDSCLAGVCRGSATCGWPFLSISDAQTLEGNNGTTDLAFTVELSVPLAYPVTVSYSNFALMGGAQPGVDFERRSGTLTFPPGTVRQTIVVKVIGDRRWEPDEHFYLFLSSAIGAGLADYVATGFILNDDPVPPIVRISNESISEGDRGRTDMAFTVTLSRASQEKIKVGYRPYPHAELELPLAAASQDYVLRPGTLTFSPGTLSKTLTVKVVGDLVSEPDEWLRIVLVVEEGAGDALIENIHRTGQGRIVNDDSLRSLAAR